MRHLLVKMAQLVAGADRVKRRFTLMSQCVAFAKAGDQGQQGEARRSPICCLRAMRPGLRYSRPLVHDSWNMRD